ncbi:DinB family protein [Quadrisphaera oryzae]|uniref:DinB family protein n=1 Tax=Quadrisphaera TaxID=317661 RepID=UPI001648688A|nr:DinB family protein [Quadrisphaera sp. RL12-1S]
MDDPRTDPPVAADEATTLVGFLDFLRDTVALKTDGLSAEQLAAVHPPSSMTLGGMLKHLAYVEDQWVGHVLLGSPPAPPWDEAPWDDDPDWDWHSAATDDPAALRGLWRSAVQRSRTDLPLDDLGRLSALERRGERVSVRYVLVHLVEEYARHAGHADLLREAVDGSTGE